MYNLFYYLILKFVILINTKYMNQNGDGDWGLGIGDWGLGNKKNY